MFFKKDNLSSFDFISVKEFLLALFLMFLSALIVLFYLPLTLKKLLFGYTSFLESHSFGIILFFLSSFVMLYIICFFCCIRKKKSFTEGLFINPISNKMKALSVLIGFLMPLITLPIIFKFAPSQFYAMDIVKTKEGLIYLFTCALFAPIFEEIFYRGFFFPFFQSKLNSFWAIVITSLFFGFSHFVNIGNAHILLSLFIFYGFVLTWIRYFSNSLIAPMITHFIHNVTLISGFLIAQKVF